MKDFFLVQSVTRNSYTLSDQGFIPFNLLVLGNNLRVNGVNPKILDCQIKHVFSQVDKSSFKPRILGINYTYMSTDELDEISLMAKNNGSVVVAGGQAATASANQLLMKNTNIDYVVKFDGEEAIVKLADLFIKGIGRLEDIPNLVYRNNDGQIVENPVKQFSMKDGPSPSREIDGIDLEWYIKNFKAFGYPELEDPFYRVTNTFSRKGCPRRTHYSGCSFCARIDSKMNSRTALQTYQEYKYLRDKYGINYIFDDSDSWIRPSWMRSLAKYYDELGELNIGLRIYGDVRDINPLSVALLKRLNVKSILLGIESGCEKTLFMNGKPMNTQQILQAVRLLANNNIKVCAAYVLGLLGETERSLDKTLDLSRQIKSIGNLQTNYWNMIVPLPGSPIWLKMMAIPELRARYGDEYKFDIEALRKDYISNFCELGNDGYTKLHDFFEYVLMEDKYPVKEYIR